MNYDENLKFVKRNRKRRSRIQISYFCFLGYAVLLSMRFNLSVAIVTMANQTIQNQHIPQCRLTNVTQFGNLFHY